MKNSVASSQTIGVTTGFKNFVLYVYSLSGAGIGLSFFFAHLVGRILLSFGGSFGFASLFLIIFAGIADAILGWYLGQPSVALRKKVGSLLVIFGFKVLTTSLLLAPIYIYARVTDPMAIFIALGVTVITFVCFSLYVFISGKDFTFRNDEGGHNLFMRILSFTIGLVLLLVLLHWICSFFAPGFADKISSLLLVICLILSIIFVIYSNAIIKAMYQDFSHDGVALSRLGVCGAVLILDTFMLLFKTLLQIFLRIRKKDD